MLGESECSTVLSEPISEPTYVDPDVRFADPRVFQPMIERVQDVARAELVTNGGAVA